MAREVASAAAQAEETLRQQLPPLTREADAAAITRLEATHLATHYTDGTKTAASVLKIATAIVPLMVAVGGFAPYAMPITALVGGVGALILSLFHKPEYATENRPPLTFAAIQAAVTSALGKFELDQEKYRFMAITEAIEAKIRAYGEQRQLSSSPADFGERWGEVFAQDRLELNTWGTDVAAAWMSMVGDGTHGGTSFLEREFSRLPMFEDECYKKCHSPFPWASGGGGTDAIPDECTTGMPKAGEFPPTYDKRDKFLNHFKPTVAAYHFMATQFILLRAIVHANVQFLSDCAHDQHERYEFAFSSFFIETEKTFRRGHNVTGLFLELDKCYALSSWPKEYDPNAKYWKGGKSSWWPWDQVCKFEAAAGEDCNYPYTITGCSSTYRESAECSSEGVVILDEYWHGDAANILVAKCEHHRPAFGIGGICRADSPVQPASWICDNSARPLETGLNRFETESSCNRKNIEDWIYPKDSCPDAYGYIACANPNYCVIPTKAIYDSPDGEQLRKCNNIFRNTTAWNI